MCLEVPPAPIYKGGRGEEAGLGRAKWGGIPLGLLVLFAPLPSIEGGKGEGKGEGEGKGGRAPSPCPIQTPQWGEGAPPHFGLPSLSPMAHVAHYFPRGVPVTPR